MKTIVLLAIFLSAALQTCRHSEQALPVTFFGRWSHSFEEDAGPVQMYRPPAYPFPAELGRDGFELDSTGRFTAYQPGPTDRPVKLSGHWKQKDQQTLEVSFDNPAYPSYKIVVIETSAAVLKIKKIP
jgi:hypothetical protein